MISGEGAAKKPPAPSSQISGEPDIETIETSSDAGTTVSSPQAPISVDFSQPSEFPLPAAGGATLDPVAPYAHNVHGEGETQESGVFPYYQDVHLVDWESAYKKCPVFWRFWHDTHTPNVEWPKGFQVLEGKLYWKGRLCIPLPFFCAFIREQHAALGHVGADRLWYHLEVTYEFAMAGDAKIYCSQVMSQCETCQAAQRSHRLAGPQEPTPVPARLMGHVAIDIFVMPEVIHEGE